MMIWTRIWLIAKKDMSDFFKDKTLLVPFVLLPLIFSVILPIVILKLGARPELTASTTGLESFLKHLSALPLPKGLQTESLALYAILIYFLLPMFMILPVMFSNLIGAYAFVGEKENHTLEGLLSTPVSAKELIAGKLLSAILPSLLATWIAHLCYGMIVNGLGKSIFGIALFPNSIWTIVGLVVSPLLVTLSTLLVFGISPYVKSSKSAQSVSLFLLFPLIGILISQSSGFMLLNPSISLGIALVLLILNGIAYLGISKTFNVEKYIAE